MEERNFAEDIVLNKYKLEDECEKHSGIYHYYSELLSTQKAKLDVEKDKLVMMESEIELEVRKNPPEDIPKLTESSIKSYLGQHPVLIEQRNKINDIKKEIYHLDTAVTSLEHKKSMISYLVTLYSMKYYSAPNTDKRTSRQDDIQDEARRSIRRRKE